MVVVPVKRELQRVVQVDEREVVANRDRAMHAFEAHELGIERQRLLHHLALPPGVAKRDRTRQTRGNR